MNTIVCKIPKKNKLIKIADRFPAGWATIAEYEDNPFASDSENSKKIQQGENRALAKTKTKAHLPRQVNQIVPTGLSFGMAVSSMDSVHHLHHFHSSSCHSNQKINNLPKAKKKCPNQQILAAVAGKQDTGAADPLKRTKTEIDAEGKFNFDYVYSEDDLMVSKEIFDHENPKKSDNSLKGNLKRNIAYWQKSFMANESVLHIIENGYKIPFFETPEKAHLPNDKSSLKNEKFVLDSIIEMLKIGSMKEVEAPPKVSSTKIQQVKSVLFQILDISMNTSTKTILNSMIGSVLKIT